MRGVLVNERGMQGVEDRMREVARPDDEDRDPGMRLVGGGREGWEFLELCWVPP